jgi:type 1 glutamine amidotransferase
MKKILALLGDYWHDALHAKEALEAGIQTIKNHEKFEVIYVSHEKFLHELHKNPDAVILYKENRLNPRDEKIMTWMTPDIAAAIMKYVDDGGSWLAWHTGMAEYPTDSDYIQMLRGYFKYHPKEHQQVTYIMEPSNAENLDPVSLFTLLDEHYFVECDTANTEVYLTSQSIDGKSIAGWSHKFGSGRVCCITPAHTKEALLDPSLSQLLGQKIEWCLEKKGCPKN